MGIINKLFFGHQLRLNEDNLELRKELTTVEAPSSAIIESITKRHRTVLENAARDIQNKINQNTNELIRLEAEYLRKANAIQSDNKEFDLSLRALNASLKIYQEAEIKEEDQLVETLDSVLKNPED